MNNMALWIHLLLLTLTFAALQTKAQECDENGNEATGTDVIDDTEETFVLTKDICIDAHRSAYLGSQCCDGDLPDDDHLNLCILWLLFLDANNNDRLTRQLSRVAECLYRRKKYIKDDENLNFDQIEADAAALGDPVKEQFMLDSYRYCGCQAKTSLEALDNDTKDSRMRKIWRMSLSKPYFYYVFCCSMDYPTTKQCPYFRFSSQSEDVTEKCENYAQQCEGLMNE